MIGIKRKSVSRFVILLEMKPVPELKVKQLTRSHRMHNTKTQTNFLAYKWHSQLTSFSALKFSIFFPSF